MVERPASGTNASRRGPGAVARQEGRAEWARGQRPAKRSPGADQAELAPGERFPMGDLVARTGVRPATIRHYVALGLLPAPVQAASNRFLYDRRHEQALRMVRLLRERRGLRLGEIAAVIGDLAGDIGEEAFRPEMWDQVLAEHQDATAKGSPAARLLAAGASAFARHGFAEVHVDDICRAARLAKGSFYRHYRSKDELFFAAAQSGAEEAGRRFSRLLHDKTQLRDSPALPGILGEALRPHLPLLLDLLALAAKRRPGHARVARSVFSTLRASVRDALASFPGAGHNRDESELIGLALLGEMRQLVADPTAPADRR